MTAVLIGLRHSQTPYMTLDITPFAVISDSLDPVVVAVATTTCGEHPRSKCRSIKTGAFMRCNESVLIFGSGALERYAGTSVTSCSCGKSSFVCETLDDAFSLLENESPSQRELYAYVAFLDEAVEARLPYPFSAYTERKFG